MKVYKHDAEWYGCTWKYKGKIFAGWGTTGVRAIEDCFRDAEFTLKLANDRRIAKFFEER